MSPFAGWRDTCVTLAHATFSVDDTPTHLRCETGTTSCWSPRVRGGRYASMSAPIGAQSALPPTATRTDVEYEADICARRGGRNESRSVRLDCREGGAAAVPPVCTALRRSAPRWTPQPRPRRLWPRCTCSARWRGARPRRVVTWTAAPRGSSSPSSRERART